MSYIKCYNYSLCDKMLPGWWKAAMKKNTCTDCHVFYGDFDSKTKTGEITFLDARCDKCNNDTNCLQSPDCSHIFCIDCFKKIELMCDSCFTKKP